MDDFGPNGLTGQNAELQYLPHYFFREYLPVVLFFLADPFHPMIPSANLNSAL
jgi:hypothetical protein